MEEFIQMAFTPFPNADHLAQAHSKRAGTQEFPDGIWTPSPNNNLAYLNSLCLCFLLCQVFPAKGASPSMPASARAAQFTRLASRDLEAAADCSLRALRTQSWQCAVEQGEVPPGELVAS